MKQKEKSLSDTEVICTHFGDHVPCFSQPVYLKQAVRNAVERLKQKMDTRYDYIIIEEIFGAKLTLLTERDSNG